MKRAWIRLPSGNRLDLINPSVEGWTDSDLAHRLARTYRWSGESSWPMPLSVAQHSLNVLALRRTFSTEPLTPGEALRELLHDAEEGLLGFDCISPLKSVLGDPFKAVSDRLMSVICDRYELPEWTPEEYRQHKLADEMIAASEAIYCIGWSRDEVREVLGITHPFLDHDPISTVFKSRPWEPWPPNIASALFESTLLELIRERDAQKSERHFAC